MNQKNNLIVKILLIALMVYGNFNMRINLNTFYENLLISNKSGTTCGIYENDKQLDNLEFTTTQYERVEIEITQETDITDPNVIRYNQNLVYRPDYPKIVHYYDPISGNTVADFISPFIPLVIYVNIITPTDDNVNDVPFLPFVDQETKTFKDPFNIRSFFNKFSWTNEIIQEYKKYQKYPGLSYYKNEEVTDFTFDSTSVNFKDPFWLEKRSSLLQTSFPNLKENAIFKKMMNYFNDYFSEISETLKQIHTDQAVTDEKYDELNLEYNKIKDLFDTEFSILDELRKKKMNKDSDEIAALKESAKTLFSIIPDNNLNLIKAELNQLEDILNDEFAPLAMIYYAAKSKMRTITKNQNLDYDLEWCNRYNDEENEINPEEFFADFFFTNDKLLYIIFSETNYYYLNHPIIIMLKNKFETLINSISDFKKTLRDSIENEEDYQSMAPFEIENKAETFNKAYFSGNPNFVAYRDKFNILVKQFILEECFTGNKINIKCQYFSQYHYKMTPPELVNADTMSVPEDIELIPQDTDLFVLKTLLI